MVPHRLQAGIAVQLQDSVVHPPTDDGLDGGLDLPPQSIRDQQGSSRTIRVPTR